MCDGNEQRIFASDGLSAEPYLDTEEITKDPRSELRGDRLTWGATPLEFNTRQPLVFDELCDRIESIAPGGTPAEVKDYVLKHFMSRFYRRQDRNHQSYEDRAVDIETLDQDSLMSLECALQGEETPSRLLELGKTLGMPSIELARLTHPFGTHMETLEEMRDAVDYAVESKGGKLYRHDEFTTYGIDGAHIRSNTADNIEAGFLMKRKRVVGKLPDGTVIMERSSFVLRIDEDGQIDQSLAAKMRKVKIDKNPDWAEEIMKAGNLQELVPSLLDSNDFDIAIPLSTTVYAYNPNRVQELEAKQKVRKAKEQQTILANAAMAKALFGSNPDED